MPTSNKYIITPVIKLVEQIKPSSVLDVGLGFGKWGFLLREYLEVWSWDKNLYDAYENKFKWSLSIDGVEICGKYVKDLQRNIYDKIFIEDVFMAVDKVANYDLFILGDVIEHFEKEKGKILLDKCFDKANKAVLVMTPATFFPQEGMYGNFAEKHKSLWTEDDFKKYGKVYLSYTRGGLIIILSKTDKNFKFENRYKLIGLLNKFIAFLQASNIRNYGIENYNRGFILGLYKTLQRCLSSQNRSPNPSVV